MLNFSRGYLSNKNYQIFNKYVYFLLYCHIYFLPFVDSPYVFFFIITNILICHFGPLINKYTHTHTHIYIYIYIYIYIILVPINILLLFYFNI